jgi:hypothetical protein
MNASWGLIIFVHPQVSSQETADHNSLDVLGSVTGLGLKSYKAQTGNSEAQNGPCVIVNSKEVTLKTHV